MDPTRYRVETQSVLSQDHGESFQELMAAQLARAPWLLLSVAVHAVAVMVFLLWVSVPPAESGVFVAVGPQTTEELDEPEPPLEEPVPNEVTNIEPELVTTEIFEGNVDTPPDEPWIAEPPRRLVDRIGIDGPGGTAGPGSGLGTNRRLIKDGGNPTVIAVIERGLQWLADHQDEDGRWDADEFMKHDETGRRTDGPGNAVHDVGITGLALLAFLADGYTLRDDGEFSLHGSVVKKGINWLRAQQEDNGRFGPAASHDFIYDHTIAAYAMCEAAGLSDSPMARRRAQAGIDYLEAHRNPYGVWRYQPRDGDNDTSVTGWAVMAYKSAQDFGMRVNETAFDHAAVWLDEVTDSRGQAGYTRRGELSSRHPGQHGSRFPPQEGEALAAVGLLCRFFLGQDPDETTVMNTAADTILASPPVWDEDTGSIDHYYWYYASYALYQLGGRHWTQWSTRLTDAVVKTQRRDGNFTGSWDPSGVWGEDGGRVYSTAMMVLTMQAYYRYTRLLR